MEMDCRRYLWSMFLQLSSSSSSNSNSNNNHNKSRFRNRRHSFRARVIWSERTMRFVNCSQRFRSTISIWGTCLVSTINRRIITWTTRNSLVYWRRLTLIWLRRNFDARLWFLIRTTIRALRSLNSFRRFSRFPSFRCNNNAIKCRCSNSRHCNLSNYRSSNSSSSNMDSINSCIDNNRHLYMGRISRRDRRSITLFKIIIHSSNSNLARSIRILQCRWVEMVESASLSNRCSSNSNTIINTIDRKKW